MAYNHKYVMGGLYAFYNNSETLEDDANFATWRLDLVHSDTFVQVSNGVASLTKDIISGTDYRFYATDFIFPTLESGCYKFIIIDTSTSNVLYISRELEVVSADTNLLYIKFRNDKNILNYNYEVLTSYYTKTHVETFKRKPLRPTISEGYSLSDGSFKRVLTVLTKTYEFITGWFDEDEHDGMQASIVHSDYQMAIGSTFKVVNTLEDVAYALEFEENYEFIQASVRMELSNRASSNKAL